jgi:hypothetical protein
MKKETMAAFENVRDQIGYCGLWCGSCGVGNGALALAARRLLEIYDGYGVPEWGPKDFDVKEFRKGLKSLGSIEGCRGCLKGDGNPDCRIRPCALELKVTDCSECGDADTCDLKESRERLYKGARAVWMTVKTEAVDPRELVERWTKDLRSQWPACVLFVGSEPRTGTRGKD